MADCGERESVPIVLGVLLRVGILVAPTLLEGLYAGLGALGNFVSVARFRGIFGGGGGSFGGGGYVCGCISRGPEGFPGEGGPPD